MPQRVRLTVPSEASSLALVGALAERFLADAGIPLEAAEPLGTLALDATRFTLDHAYPDDPTGEIEVTLDLSNGAAHIDVHDWGLPLASGGQELGPLPPGLASIDERADEVRLVNLGSDGKRLSLSVALPEAPHADPIVVDPIAPAAAPDRGVDTHIEIRDTEPDDVEAISQLLYDSYALSYGHSDFYRPRWLSEQIEEGAVQSTVAVHADAVIGHHALLIDPAMACAETGIAAVRRAFRGLGIFNRLADHTLRRAYAHGLDAVFGRAVTVHPYSQRAERSHGYHETALLLGAVPARMHMRGTTEAGQPPGRRTAHLVGYRILRPAPRPVALPERYADLIRAAYEHLDLALAPAAPADPGPTESFGDPERGTALITVGAWGATGREALRHALHQAITHHPDVLYADLDLHAIDDIDAVVEELNDAGFSYAGVLPFGRDGHDRVRLQRLNCDNVELENIVVDSEFAQELLAAVLADRARVDD